ncbi:MAG: UDP-N-acetylglucosamine 2-epimerase (non-hydrolyzing) [Dehalococcoidales bacterium]|jgi:UDP-N-acetylglucosamine 2-epimerase (non-hydrolysing)
MKIALILGTRPEIIKMSPVIRELEKSRIDYFILHTGQHYSPNLDNIFFQQLNLPQPKYNLGVGSGSHAEETGRMLIGMETVLKDEKPTDGLVEGDTNSVLAGALAAVKSGIRVGHIEAGLRSYDRRMPEEINRILVDHCADLLFAPTEKARQILLGEGIPGGKISVTGNTIVDALYQNSEISRKKSDILKKLNLTPSKYFLLTLHRQENVDDRTRFTSIISGLESLSKEYKMPVIYPIHPRSRKMIERFGLRAERLTMIEPVDFLGFLQLEENAKLILTDSGGVQEESCILRVPCVTLRDNTERPETVDVGANLLAGASPDKIRECAGIMLAKKPAWNNPFGDGRAAGRIIDILQGKEV